MLTTAAPRETGWWRRALAAGIAAADSPRTPLLVNLAGSLFLVNVLWFYNDRYVLILLPIVVALALAGR